MMPKWQRGDVVRVADNAHRGAVCVLTSASPQNTSAAWFLVDQDCASWRSTAWVEANAPTLLVRGGVAVSNEEDPHIHNWQRTSSPVGIKCSGCGRRPGEAA